MFGEEDLVKQHKKRADIITNIIVVCFAIVLARLWYLQIYKGQEFYRYSIENRLRKEVVKAPRGLVFSRNNQLLIYNIPRFDIVVIPQYLKNKKATLAKLSKVTKVSPSEIKSILSKNSAQARYRPVVIKKNATRREVAIIETESSKMPGVFISTFISREYTDKEVGAHLLGYISEISRSQLPRYKKRDNFDYRLGDFIGQAGIEEELDLQMRGLDGYEFMEVDAKGRMKRHITSNDLFKGIENKPPNAGQNVRLTIDRDLQLTAFKSLEGKVGSAVAIDIHTGEVLAMVSRPAFDPAKFSRGISRDYWTALVDNENNPLRDRAIQEHYAPGSTFKTIATIAALEEGIIDEKTEVKCNGRFRLGRRTFHCWKQYGHGKVDVIKAIRESCDVYFYKIATKLDIDKIAYYANLFGLGKKTGITLPRETTGLIPTKEWKKNRNGVEWQLGETLSCIIGQSYMLATPLQLALAYSAIANKGKLYKPHVIREIFSNDGDIKTKTEPQILNDIGVSEKTFDIVQKGLYEVVNERKGTAWWLRGRGIQMAGKTGTSQVIRFSADKIFSKCEENEYKLRHHGVFVGYAPASEPKIAVAALVEHGCHGSSAAAPIVRDVITTYMKKYEPELHKKYLAIERKKYLKEQADKQAEEANNQEESIDE